MILWTAHCRSDLSKNLVADCNYQSHFIIGNSNDSLKLQDGRRAPASGTSSARFNTQPPQAEISVYRHNVAERYWRYLARETME